MHKRLVILLLLHLCIFCAGAQSYSVDSVSVLSSGKWVKACVGESGLYRLSAKTLSSWGYNDISKVAVYSNGGAELPFLNRTERINDLAKLPVYKTNSELVFYVQGRQAWTFNSSTRQYQCKNNESDEYTYVFISDSASPSEQLEELTQPEGEDIYEITYNSTLLYHELHKNNLDKSGRDWYGELLTKQNPKLTIDFGQIQHVPSASIYLKLTLCAAVLKDRMEYNVLYNDSLVAASTVRVYKSSNEVAVSSQISKTFTHVGNVSDNKVTLLCAMTQSKDESYLDNITLEIPTKLQMPQSGILYLNLSEGVRKSRSRLSRVTITGVSKELQVWCIDNPQKPEQVSVTNGNGTLSFIQDNTKVHQYVVFDASKVTSLTEPVFVSNVDNQNIHATPAVDYLIVYHSLFKKQAEELADIHRQYSDLDVATVNVDEIYNEFGGGQRGPVAIRDFVRYVYNKGNGKLKYLLLFGAGSYDNISYGEAYPTNLIPTYQSAQSLNDTQTYSTDDFYGWLDDNELNYESSATLDIGIGRLPATEGTEAQVMVNRIRNYISNPVKDAWINRVVQFSCEGDDNEHTKYANDNANQIEKLDEGIDVSRVFSESYPMVQSTTGKTFPQAISDFYNNVNNNGAFLVNYVGHSNAEAVGEYIMVRKINLFSNNDRLPFMIGATCDFAPFDRFQKYLSKDLLTYPYGGFIAVLSTTRLVYGNYSHSLNTGMLQALLTKDENGQPRRLGDALKFAKRKTSSIVNSLKYVLLGDPALLLANNADYYVATDSVCGEPYESSITPIKALTTNYVEGTIRDANGDIMEDFNGTVETSLYDKRREKSTLGKVSPVFTYSEWGNRLFHSTHKVTNGRFSLPIQLTKDIDSSEGYGRLSYVAWSDNDNRRAIGGSNMVLVGGFADGILTDTIGPELHIYADYPSWQNGAVTSSEPLICAEMSDISGINSSGVGIGHSITMTVDNDPNSTIILNKYYSITGTNPEAGRLQYKLPAMTPGQHIVSVKVWDNMGNSTSKSISLLVTANSQITFDRIQIYPSSYAIKGEPLSMRFFHNNTGAGNTIYLSVFDLSGQLKCSAQTTLQTGTSDSGEIILTDLMPSLSSLANGVYVVNVKVVGTNGRRGEFTRKLAF